MSSNEDDNLVDNNNSNNSNASITPPTVAVGAAGISGETIRETDDASSSQVATQQQNDFIDGITTEPNIMVQRVLRYLQLFSTVISESPVWRRYSTNLSVKPVLTKSFSSMVGFCIGDMIAQILSRKVETKDHVQLHPAYNLTCLLTSVSISLICSVQHRDRSMWRGGCVWEHLAPVCTDHQDTLCMASSNGYFRVLLLPQSSRRYSDWIPVYLYTCMTWSNSALLFSDDI